VAAGGTSAVLLIELQGVALVSDNFTEGAGGELDEVITLSYQKIKITHVPSGTTFTWDINTGGGD
jgi:type VI protein secretion system component Hcp